MTLTAVEYGETGVRINTLSSGTVAGYTVTLPTIWLWIPRCAMAIPPADR